MLVLFKNNAAYFDYEITQTRNAGIVLFGHEVKACKMRQGSIQEAIVKFVGNNLVITNMQISLYEKTSPALAPGYNPKRPRTLLLRKKELAKIAGMTRKTGLSIILLEVYVNERGRIKAKIGVGKLRKKVEKKQILKERDVDREAKKEMKELRLRGDF